ncbi:MAG: hypothetical protein ACREMQ_00605 [Longimicrobiales bacterium]
MVATVNPYAIRPQVAGEAPPASVPVGPNSSYMVPGIPETDDPENTDGGYSPVLRPTGESGTLPDAIRIGLVEPPVNDPNVFGYTMARDADRKRRQSDETTHESWNVRQERLPRPVVPEWNQERAHIRPTAVRSPLGYMFERPWHIPRNILDAVGPHAETHVSMADHRRVYEIYGMAPRGRLGVNTFRLTPTPWDAELTVPLDQTTPDDGARLSGIAGNRSYRLGG